MVTRLLLGISVLAGIAYLFMGPGHVVLKGLSVAPLALAGWHELRDRNGQLLGAALLLSSLGDVLLDISPKLFAAGLGAFLLAHLVYILLFRRNHPRPVQAGMGAKAAVALVVAYSVGFTWWLIPSLGPLTPAVIAYIGAITGMVISAILLGLPGKWIAIGGVLFFVSDSILAASKFKSPVPGRQWLVWSTYYLAQCAIAIGFLRSKGRLR